MPNLTKRNLVLRISNETGVVQNKVFDVLQKTLDLHHGSATQNQNVVELRKPAVLRSVQQRARGTQSPSNLRRTW